MKMRNAASVMALLLGLGGWLLLKAQAAQQQTESALGAARRADPFVAEVPRSDPDPAKSVPAGTEPGPDVGEAFEPDRPPAALEQPPSQTPAEPGQPLGDELQAQDSLGVVPAQDFSSDPAAAFQADTPPSIHWYTDLQEAKAAAQKHDLPIVLYFDTSSQPPPSDPKTVRAHSGRVVSIHATSTSPLLSQFHVTAVPTFVVLSPDGTEIGSLLGFRPTVEAANEAVDALVWFRALQAQSRSLHAELWQVRSDWSRSSSAAALAAQVRGKLQGTNAPPELLSGLPQTAGQLLFPSEVSLIYSNEHFAEFQGWLELHELIAEKIPFPAFEFKSVSLNQLGGGRARAVLMQPADLLGKLQENVSPESSLFVDRQVKWIWQISSSCEQPVATASVVRQLAVTEQVRGQAPAPVQQLLRSVDFSMSLPADSTAVSNAFPASFDDSFRDAARQKGYEVLLVIKNGSFEQVAQQAAQPEFRLPDSVSMTSAQWQDVSRPVATMRNRQRLNALGGSDPGPATRIAGTPGTGPEVMAQRANAATRGEFKVIALEHAAAAGMASLLQQLLDSGNLGGQLAIVSDPRTNSLIVRGDAEAMQVVEALITRLDQPTASSESPKTAPGTSSESTVQGALRAEIPLGDSIDFTSANDKLAQLRQASSEIEAQASNLANQLRRLNARDQSDAGQAVQLRTELQRTVTLAFEMRQNLLAVELGQLQQRIERAQQSLKARTLVRSEIIERRVQDLLNPDLQWDQSAKDGLSTLPGADGADPNMTGPKDDQTGFPGAPQQSLPDAASPQFSLNYDQAPWPAVLNSVAKASGRTLMAYGTPPGSFNYHDTRVYSLSAAIDVLNQSLQPRGYTLSLNGSVLECRKTDSGRGPQETSVASSRISDSDAIAGDRAAQAIAGPDDLERVRELQFNFSAAQSQLSRLRAGDPNRMHYQQRLDVCSTKLQVIRDQWDQRLKFAQLDIDARKTDCKAAKESYLMARELKNRAMQTEIPVVEAERQVRRAEIELERAEIVLKSIEKSIAMLFDPSPTLNPESPAGRVTDIFDDEQKVTVALDQPSDDVLHGILEVSRTDPDQAGTRQLIALIEVIEIRPDDIVARVVERADGQSITRGDAVFLPQPAESGGGHPIPASDQSAAAESPVKKYLPPGEQEKLDLAELDLKGKHIDLESAQIEFESQRRLADHQLISAAELRLATYRVEKAQVEVDRAATIVKAIRQRLESRYGKETVDAGPVPASPARENAPPAPADPLAAPATTAAPPAPPFSNGDPGVPPSELESKPQPVPTGAIEAPGDSGADLGAVPVEPESQPKLPPEPEVSPALP